MIVKAIRNFFLFMRLGSEPKLRSPSVFPCIHDWYHETYNTMKRTCAKCGEHQWVFETRYPAIGEAKYNWRTMHYNGKRKIKTTKQDRE